MNKKASNPKPPNPNCKPKAPPPPPNLERPYRGIYDDIEYCKKEILLAREIFGNIKTTEEQYTAMVKGLTLVLFNCSKEIKSMAQATLMEAHRRREYFEEIWKEE